MAIFLGLDCGGSSSRALALDDKGNRVYEKSSGAANLASTPPARVRKNLYAALQGAPAATSVCGCFAGLIDDETRQTATEILGDIFPNAMIAARPDFVAAMYAFEEPQDVCIIAGTGSVVCSSLNGNIVRSGGRGYLLGDQGSAFALGRDAFNRYLDNPEAASRHLKLMIEEEFDTDQPSVALRKLYSAPPAPKLARLARAVARDLNEDLPYAKEIVEKNFGELAKIVRMHVERHLPGRRNLRVGLAGGIWKTSATLRNTAMTVLKESMSDLNLVLTPIKRPPVYGAVALAKELLIGN